MNDKMLYRPSHLPEKNSSPRFKVHTPYLCGKFESVIILKAIDRVRNKRYNSIKIVTIFGLLELYTAEQIDQEIHDEY